MLMIHLSYVLLSIVDSYLIKILILTQKAENLRGTDGEIDNFNIVW